MSDHADAVRHFVWNPGPALAGCRTEWDGEPFPVTTTKITEQNGDRVTVPQRKKSGRHKKPHYRRPAPKTQPLDDRPIIKPADDWQPGNAASIALEAFAHAGQLAEDMLAEHMRAAAERELNS